MNRNVQAWMEGLGFHRVQSGLDGYWLNGEPGKPKTLTILDLEATFFYRAFQAEVLKAQIAELERPRDLQLNVNHPYDYKQGFQAAACQIADGNALRIAELQAQANKQKEVADE